MSTFEKIGGEFGARLGTDFARLFDVTPNPKGATQTREALEERSPPPPAEGSGP